MRSKFSMSIRHALLLALIPATAFAAQLPKQFTLGKYVPEGVWLYIHGVHNPEREWIDREWSQVFDALKASGVDKDVMSLVMSLLDTESRGKAQAQIQKATQLLGGVQWRDLGEQEFVFSEHFSADPNGFSFEYLLLMRGKDGTGEANFRGLTTILKEVASLMGRQVNDSKATGIDVCSLQLTPAGHEGFPFSVELFRKGDVIGVTTSKRQLGEITALINGKAEKKSIAESARFQQALGDVEPAEDVVVFFDAKSFAADMRLMLGHIADEKPGAKAKTSGGKRPGAEGKPAEGPVVRAAMKTDPPRPSDTPGAADGDDAKIMAVINKAIDLFDFSEYAITSTETNGRRELSHSAWKIQEGKQTSPVAKLFLNRKPFTRFDEFIPADATGFSLSDSIDLEGLYKLIKDFIIKEVPGGEAIWAQVNAGLAQVGFDPQRDLFDWWSGEAISVELPAAIVSPMGGGADWVAMIRVKNAELASTKVNGWLDKLAAKLKAEGQMLMISPAKVSAGSFREVTHPMLAMMLKPVIGVSGDWLIIGANAGAINKCLDVAAKKSPSIAENARFKEEGLIPKGPVMSLSFKDTSKFGQELGGAIGMLGMFGGIAISGMPEDTPDAKQGKQVLQSVLQMAMKLGPVLQKIDFYSSEASMSTYDGKLLMRTEKVCTYKQPKDSAAEKSSAPKAPVPPTPPPAPKPPAPPDAPKPKP